MINKYLSDDSFDKIFDVTPIIKNVKNNSIGKYILIILIIFGFLGMLTTIRLNYEEVLE